MIELLSIKIFLIPKFGMNLVSIIPNLGMNLVSIIPKFDMNLAIRHHCQLLCSRVARGCRKQTYNYAHAQIPYRK